MKKFVLMLLFVSVQLPMLDAAPRVRAQSARIWPRLSRVETPDHPLVPVVQYLLKH
ncbi:hypothetical protein [Abditibacterium utsteinense]|uniref:hypothetical protein n=1 Tax=Abditibacterium utsteinense TaxID=1960156 RepID=UPI0013008701|nr:hypothetical protein [Abditibacterium utsteinense]